MIVGDIVLPGDISFTLDDVGGLHRTKEIIWETILLPLLLPYLPQLNAFDSSSRESKTGRYTSGHSLLSAPLGALFYGPPGTGKTLMAKAIAKECSATFIPVNFSTLQSKWFGESQKLVRAVFSIARKFAPSIIFIDEIDVFLSSRGGEGGGPGGASEAASTIKGEFMTLWDGLAAEAQSNDHPSIIVLGCSNRPFDIDPAFLRRMPRQILFDLPGPEDREDILEVLLSDANLDEAEKDPIIDFVVAQTRGYSGSDLKELAKFAALRPIREFMRQNKLKIVPSRRSKKGTRAERREKEARREARDKAHPAEEKHDDDNDDDDDDDDDDSDLNNSDDQDADLDGNHSPAESIAIYRPRKINLDDFRVALQHIRPTGTQAMAQMIQFYDTQRNEGRGAGVGGDESFESIYGTAEERERREREWLMKHGMSVVDGPPHRLRANSDEPPSAQVASASSTTQAAAGLSSNEMTTLMHLLPHLLKLQQQHQQQHQHQNQQPVAAQIDGSHPLDAVIASLIALRGKHA